jgi:hypothetical protein
MKKIAVLFAMFLLVLACSENYSKKKTPPKPPQKVREARPQDSKTEETPQQQDGKEEQNKGSKVE